VYEIIVESVKGKMKNINALIRAGSAEAKVSDAFDTTEADIVEIQKRLRAIADSYEVDEYV